MASSTRTRKSTSQAPVVEKTFGPSAGWVDPLQTYFQPVSTAAALAAAAAEHKAMAVNGTSNYVQMNDTPG